MKIPAVCALLLILTGCTLAINKTPAPPTGQAPSQWYRVGYHDALAGKIVRDNNTLAEWFGNPQIDRNDYLKGYIAGQADVCQPDTVRAWGAQGRNFPAACDGVANAEQLRGQWQRGEDKATH